MIAYEDLVSALAAWRARNGLPVGAADYLGEPPPPEPVSFAAYESRPELDLQLVGESEDIEVPIEDAAPVEEVALADELSGSDYAMDGEWPAGDVDVAEEAILAEEAVRADSADSAAAVAEVVEDDSYGIAVDSYDDAAHAYTADGDSIDELAADDAIISEALTEDEQPTQPPDEESLAAAIDAGLAEEGPEDAPLDDAPLADSPFEASPLEASPFEDAPLEAESLEAEVDLSDFPIPEEAGGDATVVGASPAPDDGQAIDPVAEVPQAAPAPDDVEGDKSE